MSPQDRYLVWWLAYGIAMMIAWHRTGRGWYVVAATLAGALAINYAGPAWI